MRASSDSRGNAPWHLSHLSFMSSIAARLVRNIVGQIKTTVVILETDAHPPEARAHDVLVMSATRSFVHHQAQHGVDLFLAALEGIGIHRRHPAGIALILRAARTEARCAVRRGLKVGVRGVVGGEL